MPVFKDSYDTTMGMVFVMKPVIHAIKESLIKNGDWMNLNVMDKGNIRPVFITGVYESDSIIPLFTHPITVLGSREDFTYLVTDMRVFIRKDTPTDNIEKSIKNLTEFNFAKSRAILNLIWLDNGQSQIKNSLQFAGVVFCRWLSEIIAKTYALDFKDQTSLAIIASFYYQSLFSEDRVFDEDTKQKMAVHTIKATEAPANLVFEIFDKMPEITGIEDFCNAVPHILENVRLKNFNLAILLTIVKNSWYGTNAKDIISVALEHPPTWIAVVYTALTERTYKSSMVYRIAERFGKRGRADEFNDSYVTLVKSVIKPQPEQQVAYSLYD